MVSLAFSRGFRESFAVNRSKQSLQVGYGWHLWHTRKASAFPFSAALTCLFSPPAPPSKTLHSARPYPSRQFEPSLLLSIASSISYVSLPSSSYPLAAYTLATHPSEPLKMRYFTATALLAALLQVVLAQDLKINTLYVHYSMLASVVSRNAKINIGFA